MAMALRGLRMMLLATSGTRAFGLNAPGVLTARQALEAAGDGDRLTLEGLEVQARSLPDVLALAQNRVSVVALAVEDGATTTMIVAVAPDGEAGAVTSLMEATAPDRDPEAAVTMKVTPDDPTPSTGTAPKQLAMW